MVMVVPSNHEDACRAVDRYCGGDIIDANDVLRDAKSPMMLSIF